MELQFRSQIGDGRREMGDGRRFAFPLPTPDSRLPTALLCVFFLAMLALPVFASEPAPQAAKFTTVDIIVDAGADSLAAYQVEITTTGDARIVGVEGGEHSAYKTPPYYDPAALRGGRIILANFSTSASLPSGRTRVATLQMREVGPVTYRVRLIAAARADGSRFAPAVSAVAGGGR
jgi:hypothetical protein